MSDCQAKRSQSDRVSRRSSKIAFVKNELGVDETIDYKAVPNLTDALTGTQLRKASMSISTMSVAIISTRRLLTQSRLAGLRCAA